MLKHNDPPNRLFGQLRDHILEKIVSGRKNILQDSIEYALQKESAAK